VAAVTRPRHHGNPTRLALLLCTAAALLQLALPAGARADAGWAWPVQGQVITPYRNGDDPYAGGQHRGIDVGAPVGSAVAAATAGTVRFAGSAASSGLTVTVRTADGRFDTSYLHLSSLGVRAGARVALGERIGAVGTSGRRSATAPHLHFGVREAGSRLAYHDPLEFLPPPPLVPAPRGPTGAPLPVPAPLRPGSAPERGPVAAPRPRRVPVPARRPAGRRLPAPGRLPRRAPHGAARPLPAPVAAASAAEVPSAEAGPRTARHPQPDRHASLGAAPHVRPAPAAGAARARTPAAGPEPAGGPDLGWALACVGLLVAAALVGGTEDGRAAATRGRARLAAAFRPVSAGGKARQ
jgi:peptidase M23-like protein